jgi:hypothetical protein
MMMEAAERMFNVSNEEDFDCLFIPCGHAEEDETGNTCPEGRLPEEASAKELAAHIREFVKERYQRAPAELV